MAQSRHVGTYLLDSSHWTGRVPGSRNVPLMATAGKLNASAIANPTASIADRWASAEAIEGQDLVQKNELVDKEFLITSVRFERSNAGIDYAYVTGAFRNGEEFEFNDSSSSGVKAQLWTYLEGKGLSPSMTSSEIHETAILVPKGLRVSEFTATDNKTGKPKLARTYYLTLQRPSK